MPERSTGHADYRAEPRPSAWPPPANAAFWTVAVSVLLLTCAYSFFIEREISHDEAGLYNPIYNFLNTGAFAYPLHGQPDYMTVHPPTHYLITALLMKLGLPLFAASAVPVVVLMAVVVLAAATGGFPLALSLAMVVGCFLANVIWADYFTVRPDLHLTMAWFAGLAMLEAAKNRGWSRWRLFAGTALCVFAATLHYWGLPSLSVPIVYAVALVSAQRSNRATLRNGLLAIAAGGLAVGVPFLLFFVFPLWEPILAVVASVQGEGGMAAAFDRHLTAYANLSRRVTDGWAVRPVAAALTAGVLRYQVPAVIPAVILLLAMRRVTLALAGLTLPAFVLLYSQGKAVEQTLYFTPEMTLYLVAVLGAVFCGVAWIARRSQGTRRALSYALGGLLVAAALASVPYSSGRTWRWTSTPYGLAPSRAAALDIVGADALVGMVSVGPWYSGGGRYVWNAADNLTEVNQSGGDVTSYLRAADAFVIDFDWWHALPNLAPLTGWYLEDKLSLLGFVLPTRRGAELQLNLFVAAAPPPRVRGYFVSSASAQLFEQREGGSAAFSVWVCPSPIPEDAFEAFHQVAFHFDAPPGSNSRVLALVGSTWNAIDSVQRTAADLGCREKDLVRGNLTDTDTRTLVSGLEGNGNEIYVSTTFSDVVAASRTGGRGGAPPEGEPENVSIMWANAGVHASASWPGGRLPVTVGPPEVPWGYGAVLPLDVRRTPGRSLLLQIQARVLDGNAGFGVVNEKQDAFVARTFREASSEPVTVNLVIPPGTPFGPLIIQNGPRQTHTRVELQSVRAFEIPERRPRAAVSR